MNIEKVFKLIIDKLCDSSCKAKTYKIKNMNASLNKYFKETRKYFKKCGEFTMDDNKAVIVSAVDVFPNDFVKTRKELIKKKWNVYPTYENKKWKCFYQNWTHHWQTKLRKKDKESKAIFTDVGLKHTAKWEGMGVCFMEGVKSFDSLHWQAKMASVNHDLGLYSFSSLGNIKSSYNKKMMQNYTKETEKTLRIKSKIKPVGCRLMSDKKIKIRKCNDPKILKEEKEREWLSILSAQFSIADYKAKYIMTNHGIAFDTPEMRGRYFMAGLDNKGKLVAVIFPTLF